MIVKHKTNNEFMFYTDNWIKRFNNWKINLKDKEVEQIKRTEDYKKGLIILEEKKLEEKKVENKKVNKKKG